MDGFIFLLLFLVVIAVGAMIKAKQPASPPPYVVHRTSQSIATEMTTTSFILDGHRVTKNLGVVRGITVRSRSMFGTIGGSLQALLGGNVSLFTQLCEQTRNEAFDLMLEHAKQMGANAVTGVRYDATEVMQGISEVLCYGTAVIVEPVNVRP